MLESKEVKAIESPIIAEMYGRWTLDCIVEVAHAVALDFVNRPATLPDCSRGRCW